VQAMNCLFCKKDATGSRSVEHVIPESIGNTEHTLPPGVVCDKCNNYFSVKVEGPLLNMPYFRDLCYRSRIKNKKGNPPRVQGIHRQSLLPVDLFPDMDGDGASIGASHPHDERRWIASLRMSSRGSLIVPIPTEPDEQLLSRFLAKVAIEALALRVLKIEGGIREIIQKKELDPLRDYARRNVGVSFWPFHRRALYPPDFLFTELESAPYEVLHEWTFLYTTSWELYLILALFGTEYALNLGGPEIDGYKAWLVDNSQQSPLYPRGLQATEQHLPPDIE